MKFNVNNRFTNFDYHLSFFFSLFVHLAAHALNGNARSLGASCLDTGELPGTLCRLCAGQHCALFRWHTGLHQLVLHDVLLPRLWRMSHLILVSTLYLCSPSCLA